MNEFSSCVKCGNETAALDARFCTVCGGEMLNSQKAKQLGWAMLILGLFLASLVVFIVVWYLVSDVHFSGSAGPAMLAIIVGMIVLAMGVVGIVGGVWQIKYGRRNKTITQLTLGLASAFVVVARTGRRLRP